MDYYRQCNISRADVHMTTWLPESLVRVGRYLRFDDLGDGWKVENVSQTRLSLEDMRDRSQDYKRTREASDI